MCIISKTYGIYCITCALYQKRYGEMMSCPSQLPYIPDNAMFFLSYSCRKKAPRIIHSDLIQFFSSLAVSSAVSSLAVERIGQWRAGLYTRYNKTEL